MAKLCNDVIQILTKVDDLNLKEVEEIGLELREFCEFVEDTIDQLDVLEMIIKIAKGFRVCNGCGGIVKVIDSCCLFCRDPNLVMGEEKKKD